MIRRALRYYHVLKVTPFRVDRIAFLLLPLLQPESESLGQPCAGRVKVPFHCVQGWFAKKEEKMQAGKQARRGETKSVFQW